MLAARILLLVPLVWIGVGGVESIHMYTHEDLVLDKL
jgi:hypothetical protein